MIEVSKFGKILVKDTVCYRIQKYFLIFYGCFVQCKVLTPKTDVTFSSWSQKYYVEMDTKVLLALFYFQIADGG